MPHEKPALVPDIGTETLDLASGLEIDFEADNVLLRAALVNSESAGLRRDLIAQELKHRMGNLLAVVGAIVRQTFKTSDAENLSSFSARLDALAAAQKVLIDSENCAATVLDVVKTSLAPHCSSSNQTRISGSDVSLDGRRAHALKLALHELATNAAKYGALSTESGWVEIFWTQANDGFELLWREHGGPQVYAPLRRGFGVQLIKRNLAVAFAGHVDLDFDSDGVVCRLRAPATQDK